MGKMNIERNRNETRNLLDQAFSTKENCVRFGANETFEHAWAKFVLCWEAHLEEKHFVTEAIFAKGSGRADILILDDNEVWEVLHSESVESLEEKMKKYPVANVLGFSTVRVIEKNMEEYCKGWTVTRNV